MIHNGNPQYMAEPVSAPIKAATPDAPIRVVVIGVRGVPNVIGGIETHCEQLYPALVDRGGFHVTILARRQHVAQRSAVYRRVDVIGLAAPHGPARETVVHTLVSLLYARLRLRPDIVHLHGIGPAFFTPLARALGMRVIVTDHASDFERPKWGRGGRWFLKAGETMAARFATRIVCVSAALRDEMVQRHPRAAARTVVIRHGITTQPMASASDAASAVLSEQKLTPGGYLIAVGRLEATKRFDDLIRAHRLAGPDALPLVMVGSSIGDTAYEEELRRAAGPGVHFVGFRHGPELAALYANAAALVHPSAMEGFALVVLEALAAGVPAYVSDIPVHREFGLDEGAHFPVGDVAALSGLLARIRRREGVSDASLAIAARHDLAATVAAHAHQFRAVTNRQVARSQA